MTGLGTIINCAAIIAGGLAGHLTGRLFKKEQQDSLTMACGISVLFIAIAGAMQGMLRVDGNELLSGKSMLRNPGRDFRGLFHPGREVRAGLHHHRGDDFFPRKRRRLLRHPDPAV